MPKMWDKWERQKKIKWFEQLCSLEEGNTFCSKVTEEKYKIRQEINCRSRSVIYLVNCMKCPKQNRDFSGQDL